MEDLGNKKMLLQNLVFKNVNIYKTLFICR